MEPKPYRLAVKAVIVDGERRCLLVRRSAANRHFAHRWEWPGGKVDPGEDFADAVRREVREETGLEVEITGLAGATQFEMPAGHIVLLCMEARVTGGVQCLSDEHDQAAWVPLAELGRWALTDQVAPFMLNYAKERA